MATPVGPRVKAKAEPKMNEKLTMPDKGTLEAEVNDGDPLEDYLRNAGLNPDEWEVTGMRKSQWQTPSGEDRHSVRYTMRRVYTLPDVPLDDLFQMLEHPGFWNKANGCAGPEAYIIGIGDMQFGKIDGDGVEGTLERTIDYLNKAAERISILISEGHQIGHVHVAWLGDHIEGFNSQGGALVWRTQLPLTHQMRLTRAVMMHAVRVLAPLVDRLTMAAVPGNHGEPVRFAGKGITTYDDSLDTEALVAVMEACAGRPEFEHVEFYLPENDELTVVLEVGGMNVMMAHGHKFSPNKHFEWWKGQAFNNDAAWASGLLLTGHLHHDHIEREGRHLWVGCGSLEYESTHFRHRTGATGHPGITGLHVVDGEVASIDFIS